jgi:hypothetical protein
MTHPCEFCGQHEATQTVHFDHDTGGLWCRAACDGCAAAPPVSQSRIVGRVPLRRRAA